MSANYQKLMKLLERWPVDKTKGGRDFGVHLRKQLQGIINPSAVTTNISDKLTHQINALERISNNVHGNKYKRSLSSTATGLTAEQCNQVLSSEFLQYLNEEQGLFK